MRSDTLPTLRSLEAAARAEAEKLVGQVLSDRYRIEELLAMGGMGSIYRGEHLRMHKRVAIKVLHPRVTPRADLVKRFEREAIAGAHVQHLNVAVATDFGELEDGTSFLVIEYVKGRPLNEIIRGGPLPTRRALHIARQLAAALDAVHGQGIIHRDVKARNVMVVEDDDDLTKLIDFGLAKVSRDRISTLAAAPRDPDDEVTLAGTVIGTVAYMAPECALGMDAVDARSDLYALGILIYEMLAGARPFQGDSLPDLFRAQRLDKPPPFKDRAPHRRVPPFLESIVMRLLDKDPGRRFASAALLGEALDLAMSIDAADRDRPTPPPSSSPPVTVRMVASPEPPPARDMARAPGADVARAPGADVTSTPDADVASVPDSDVASVPEGTSISPHTTRAPSPPEARRPHRTLSLLLTAVALALGVGALGLPEPATGLGALGLAEPADAVLACSALARTVLPPAPPSVPEHGRERDPTSSGESAGSAPSAPAPGLAHATVPQDQSAPPPPAFDEAWRAVLRRSAATRDWSRGQVAFHALIEGDPEAFGDPTLVIAAAEVANAVAHGGGDPSTSVFDALATRLGASGLDVLYQIVASRGGTSGARLAGATLAKEDVLARATVPMRIAFLLRTAPCKDKLALLDRAVAEGDVRALQALETGGRSCFGKNQDLDRAIAALHAKL